MDVTPDLLTFADGTTVDLEGWPRRRQELSDAIVPHEYGGLPPCGAETTALRRSNVSSVKPWPGVRYFTFEVRTRFDDGQELSLTLSLWVPPGDGPFPVILDGDGCWRYFDDHVVQKVLARGCIAASFDRTEAAADNADNYRETGLYRLFPDAEFGVLSTWAWGFHRCVDALEQIDQARADQIAITGHSRGGKTVLLAGATDERIAIVNPNDSGIGGGGLNHWKSAGSEEVDSFFGSRNIFWFGKAFADLRHRDAELPYDQHFLHALVAPRKLLLTEAYEDPGANPPGTYLAAQAARPMFDLLGATDGIGWAIREGGHSHHPSDYEALLDFVDVHFHGKQIRRDFQRPLFPQLSEILKRT